MYCCKATGCVQRENGLVTLANNTVGQDCCSLTCRSLPPVLITGLSLCFTQPFASFSVPPKVTVSMSPQTVNRSQSATFSCVVNVASPAATIALFSPRNQSISHVNGSAVLENRTRDDSGSYSCVASNGVEGSPVTKRTTLTVNREYAYSLTLSC